MKLKLWEKKPIYSQCSSSKIACKLVCKREGVMLKTLKTDLTEMPKKSQGLFEALQDWLRMGMKRWFILHSGNCWVIQGLLIMLLTKANITNTLDHYWQMHTKLNWLSCFVGFKYVTLPIKQSYDGAV